MFLLVVFNLPKASTLLHSSYVMTLNYKIIFNATLYL